MKAARIGALLLTVAVMTGCNSFGDSAQDAMVKVKLGHYIFHIPEQNSMEKSRPFWIDLISGLDDGSRDTNIVFTEAEIRRAIPNYRSDLELYGTLAVLNNEDVQRFEDPNLYADLWYGRGKYRDQAIDPIGNGELYRVRYGGQNIFWEIVRLKPDAGKAMPREPQGFLVASCYALEGSETGAGNSCRTHALFGDLVVEFSVEEHNLVHFDRIRAFLMDQVLSWKQD